MSEMAAGEGTPTLKKFTCEACKREFESTQEDVDRAGGHLCLAAERGLSQHEAINEILGGGS